MNRATRNTISGFATALLLGFPATPFLRAQEAANVKATADGYVTDSYRAEL